MKAAFLRQLEDEIFLYCEDHCGAGITALAKQFGTPEEVAVNFLSELGPSAVGKFQRTRQWILYGSAAIVVAAVVLVSAVELYARFKQLQALDCYYIESITYQGEVTPYVTGPTYRVDYSYGEGNSIPAPEG